VPQTSWLDHLDAVRDGKWELLSEETLPSYQYEVVLDDGSKTLSSTAAASRSRSRKRSSIRSRSEGVAGSWNLVAPSERDTKQRGRRGRDSGPGPPAVAGQPRGRTFRWFSAGGSCRLCGHLELLLLVGDARTTRRTTIRVPSTRATIRAPELRYSTTATRRPRPVWRSRPSTWPSRPSTSSSAPRAGRLCC